MTEQNPSSDGIILILGATGAGKSYLVNKLKESCVEEGHTLVSKTTQCQAVEIILDDDTEDKRSITVVDTPGFDDTTRLHGEILSEITTFLAAQRALKIPLRGVLYLHKITDNRMTGSSVGYLQVLQSIIGDDAMENLILVTTMWNKVRDEHYGEALRREQELLDGFWAPMQAKGSYVAQFDGTSDAALALLWQLAGKSSVMLQIQQEIEENDNVDVLHTTAGSNLLQKLETDRREYGRQLSELDRKLAVLQQEKENVNKATIKELNSEKVELQNLLKQIDRSIVRMKDVHPRSRVWGRVRQAVADNKGGATAILAAVLNISLFVVKLTVF